MSELVFVRHGQASFGADSYDKLSQIGKQQVKLLAKHWSALSESFDCIYTGDLQRQRETAEILRSAMSGTAADITPRQAFNEYNGDELIRIYLRDYGDQDGHATHEKLPYDDNNKFQKLFEAAAARWIKDELNPGADEQGFEYWGQFRERVHGAIAELMEVHQRGKRVLIATSGGVIALAMQYALGIPDEQTIMTNWMVYNSSVTRIRYGASKVSLTAFNSVAHMEQVNLRHLITFR